MPLQNRYILKLGGSVITEKAGNQFQVRQKTLARIAQEIARALQGTHFSLIIVHGAGPFGHMNVMNYALDNGITTKKQKEGLAKTIADCNSLDAAVVQALQKAGVSAQGCDPNKIVFQENKKMVSFDITKIAQLLQGKKVPVLYGQMVPDKKLHASVLSGDTIVGLLAKKFSAQKVLLGTDVSGIFSADPKKDKNAYRINKITKKNFPEIIQKVSGSAAVDVTGGMKGKLLQLKERLSGKKAFIFNANEKGAVYNSLVGKKVSGTIISL